LDASGLDEPDMLRIAADVGFSETAFLVVTGENGYDVRYFSPRAEVPFCGHATIASAVALAEAGAVEPGAALAFNTRAGHVGVRTGKDADGRPTAELASVPTSQRDVTPEDLAEALAALRWSADELDPALAPKVAYAGAHHLVLAVAERERLARLDYDVDRLRGLMERREWTTLQLVWRESATVFHARDPFPVGGVVEDPA